MLALLVLHRAKLLASNQSILAFGVAPSGVRAAAPHSAPFRGKGVWGFGKDAEIERPKALQDAKPTKRSYRDREFALSYKKTDFFNTLVSPTVRLSGIFVCCTINRT